MSGGFVTDTPLLRAPAEVSRSSAAAVSTSPDVTSWASVATSSVGLDPLEGLTSTGTARTDVVAVYVTGSSTQARTPSRTPTTAPSASTRQRRRRVPASSLSWAG